MKKMRIFMSGFLLLHILANAQNNKLLFSVRVPLQLDFQKAYFKDVSAFPYNTYEHSATVINAGIDLLAEKKIANKWQAYIGVGYFNNKFNFKRAYDHSLLNIGTDSIPVGTVTSSYVYNLFRLPIGVLYKLTTRDKYSFGISLEDVVNFSFSQVYNGPKPFAGANNKSSLFHYFGNSIIFLIQISRSISNTSSLQLEPYFRIINNYKKDPVLYETAANSNAFDAGGLAIKYSFTLK